MENICEKFYEISLPMGKTKDVELTTTVITKGDTLAAVVSSVTSLDFACSVCICLCSLEALPATV